MNNEDRLIKVFDDAIELAGKFTSPPVINDFHSVEERYKIINLIGEGTSKKVFLAEDILMKRKVAYAELKGNQPLLVENFIKEARLISNLEHACIAPIYDIGINKAGSAYFVMKLYEGQTLSDFCETMSLPLTRSQVEQLVDIFLKICEAVSYAHRKGILHLDIKPGNIRINSFGGVLLCDWGISRMIYEVNTDRNETQPTSHGLVSEATILGVVQGTPGYMAPEQENKYSICDLRTDVFGLGALLYRILTGKIYENSFCFLNSLTNCPVEVQQICRKSLAADPDERYKNVKRLIEDIHAYRKGLVIRAEKGTFAVALKKWVKRHKILVLSLIVYILSVVVIFIYYVSRINHEKNRLSRAAMALKEEKQAKMIASQAQAQRYFKQARILYKTATSSNGRYSQANIAQAIKMLNISIATMPDFKEAWILLGNLYTLKNEFTKASNCYLQSKNTHYIDFITEFKNWNKRLSAEQYIHLIESVDKLEDKALRNQIIKRAIYIFRKQEERYFLAGELIKKVNQDINNICVTEDVLDLRGNQNMKIIFPIILLSFKNIYLSGTSVRPQSLKHLRDERIQALDVSGLKLEHFKPLINKKIDYLDVSNCPILQWNDPGGLEVGVLKMTGVETLPNPKKFFKVGKILCDESQFEVLNLLFKNMDVKIELITSQVHSEAK